MSLTMFDMSEFDTLCDFVQGCRKCPRMSESLRVLNRSGGSLSAQIMFVGEAPGRLGADSSGIPFHGDKSGHNFEDLLKFAGLDRSNIFVTNAVLCNPKDEKGNNSTPTKIEIKNCTTHLSEQIRIIDPKIVVTLGATALESTRLTESHNLNLKENVRTSNRWYGRTLIPLYHPGQRAMLHRSFANQRSDYQFVFEQLNRLTKTKNKQTTYKATKIDIAVIVEYILRKLQVTSYFTLHKLFYLIEYNAFNELGSTLTDAYIIRQKDGPYCTDLHLAKLKKSIPNFNYFFKGKSITVSIGSNDLFSESLLDEFDLEDYALNIIDKVLEQNGHKSATALKRTVYFSRPMRNFLKAEKELNMNLYNSPIVFHK